MYILFKGIYDTTDLYTDEIIACFKEHGIPYHVLNYETMGEDLEALPSPPYTVITFNNIGYNMGTEEGENLWDALGATFINVIMDHPFHYMDKLRNLPKNSILLCIDKNHVDFVHRFIPEIKDVRFEPHFGCVYCCDRGDGSGDCYESPEPSPRSSRDIDVLYAGSLSRVLIEQLIPDFNDYPEIDGVDFSQRVLTRLISEPEKTTEEVIEEELDCEGVLRYIEGFRFLDGFAVSYFRELAVRILVENGIKVHVLGLGWETLDWADNSNLIHLGKCDAPEVLSYMKRSKIVLNTLTWFKDGAHDRIFNGMLCGAAVVTDGSKYLDENVENITTFNLKKLNGLPQNVNDLLIDEKKLSDITSKARKEAEESHTVENFLKDLGILPKINI